MTLSDKIKSLDKVSGYFRFNVRMLPECLSGYFRNSRPDEPEYAERLESRFGDNGIDTELVDENIIRFALRDEYINIMAMTKGGIEAQNNHQILICKKTPISNENGLFLLDAKKSASTYDLSKEGKKYYSSLAYNKGNDFVHEYAARIVCQLRVKIVPELFEKLYIESLFALWTPEAPIKYFEGCEDGYLVVFRVFKLKQPVPKSLLEKGSKGRNCLFRLAEEVCVEFDKPVIEEEKFSIMKNDLLEILNTNNWHIQE